VGTSIYPSLVNDLSRQPPCSVALQFNVPVRYVDLSIVLLSYYSYTQFYLKLNLHFDKDVLYLQL